MIQKYQKGVSLIISLFIMTIMLAIILSMSTVVFNRIKIFGNIGNSLSSFYAAHTGIEKTLYFDRKIIPLGSNRGLCNTCNACSGSDCTNCQATTLSVYGVNGCDPNNCVECKVTYGSTFNNRNYNIETTVSQNQSNCQLSNVTINAKGFYRDASRAVDYYKSGTMVLPPVTTISRRQSMKATSTGTTINAIWNNYTIPCNFLVAVVHSVNSDSNPLITPPTGWTLAVSRNYGSIPFAVLGNISIFYRQNVPSQDTTGNFVISDPGYNSLVVAEYYGIASSPLDRTASNAGTNTAPSTGTTAVTTQAKELLIGGLGSAANVIYSNSINSFTIVEQNNFTRSNVFLERIVNATSTYGTGATQSQNSRWAGVVATFKGN